MADVIHQATGTADAQLVTGAGKLSGFSVRESGAVAAVTSALLRDGTSTSGKPLVFVELAADTAQTVNFTHPIEFTNGLFLDRSTAGETEVVVYIV